MMHVSCACIRFPCQEEECILISHMNSERIKADVQSFMFPPGLEYWAKIDFTGEIQSSSPRLIFVMWCRSQGNISKGELATEGDFNTFSVCSFFIKIPSGDFKRVLSVRPPSPQSGSHIRSEYAGKKKCVSRRLRMQTH